MTYEYTIISNETSVPLRYVTGLQEDAHLNCQSGESVVAGRVEITASASELWPTVRQLRDSILASTDWTQMPDVRFNAGVQSAWATYRQALRNVPANNADCISINDIVWPTVP